MMILRNLGIKRTVRLLLGITAIVVVASPLAAATTWTTKVDRSKFRISLADDGIVNVVDKAVITGRSMQVRDKMRIAVKQATGCDLTDELWFDAKLKGKLKCPEGQKPLPGDAPSK